MCSLDEMPALGSTEALELETQIGLGKIFQRRDLSAQSKRNQYLIFAGLMKGRIERLKK
jgi:hypothetical protein